MEKVRITRVAKNNKDKEGNLLKNKRGLNYWRVSIQTDRYGDKWLSAFANKPEDREMQIKEGDEINIMVERKGDFLNFSLPTKADLLEERIYALEHRVSKLESAGKPSMVPGTEIPYPSGPNPNDVPW